MPEEDERLAVERHLREFDRLGEDLKVIERDLARSALGDEGVKRLMTIPRSTWWWRSPSWPRSATWDATKRSQKLVAISASTQASDSQAPDRLIGRITKQGRGHARGMLVEAAWAAARAPGPLRAFFLQSAPAAVSMSPLSATARKLAVLIPSIC